MKLNGLDKEIVNVMEPEKVLTIGTKPATIAKAIANVLMTIPPKGEKAGTTVVDNYAAAIELNKNPKSMDMDKEQVEFVKEHILTVYAPMVAAPVLQLLEEKQ